MSQDLELVSGWVLEELLGKGSFGTVWRARRPGAELPRALKLVRVSGALEFRSWRQEIERLDDLSSDHVVRFYDAGMVETPGPYRDHAWIATELCTRSLTDEFRRRSSPCLTVRECGTLLEAMLRALAAAQARACIHRDVKPSNILLARDGAWKLADFGIARLVPSGAKYAGTFVLGTVAYMSADALAGKQDYAADRYALGVTLHQALTGNVLHPRRPGVSDGAYVAEVVNTPPRVDPLLGPRWGGIIEALIGRKGSISAQEILRWIVDTGDASALPPWGSNGGAASATERDQDEAAHHDADHDDAALVPTVEPTIPVGDADPVRTSPMTPTHRQPAKSLAAQLRPWASVATGVAVILILFLLTRLAA